MKLFQSIDAYLLERRYFTYSHETQCNINQRVVQAKRGDEKTVLLVNFA